MRKKILKGIARLCFFHHRKILLVFLGLFAMAFLLTGRLQFDPDFLKLFPAEKGAIKLYLENLKQAGTFDLLFILLEKEKGAEHQPFTDFGREMAEGLKKMEIDGKPAFKNVRYQKMELEDLEKAMPVFSLFLTHPYLFLDEEDIPKLKEKWTEAEISKQIRKNRRVLVSQASFAMKDLIRIDPLELRWLFMEKWSAGMKGMEFDASSPFFLSKDGNSLLIITEPLQPASALSFSNNLMKKLKEFVSEGTALEARGIKVFFTGAHPIATAEAKTLRFDMQSSFITSLILVLLLFLLVYRRWVTLLFVGLPLLGGIQLTMGIASLTLGSLNILTSAFAAILVGLGIDFGLHLYDRYQQERALGKEVSSAMETTLSETGAAIWTGALTTISAFAILFFSRIRGIMELAFIVSVGLLCALLCITFVLPSFLIWIDGRKKAHAYPALQSLGYQTLSSFLRNHARAVVLCFAAVTLFLAFYGLRIEVEKDLRNLRPKGVQSLGALEQMAKAFGGRRWEAVLVREGRDLSGLLSKEEETIPVLNRYQNEGKIESFVSLASLVPSPERQRKILKALRESFDWERVREDLRNALKANGFEVKEFEGLLRSLEAIHLGDAPIFQPEALLERLERSPFKRGLEPLLKHTGETYRLATPIYYQRGRLSLEALERELRGVSVTGAERVEAEILRLIREDLFLLSPLSFLMILLLVFSHFRKWRVALLTLVPLATGLTWMLGAMGLLGIRINFVNAVVLPMIIGMGIDNSIHLMHRYLEQGAKDPAQALRTTGRAMTMCTVTTMLGFGSLVTARYQALTSMGWVTLLGMGSCLIGSLVLLPSMLMLLGGRRGLS
ncbi:MAG: MMPL family transporter [Desulfobacterota bacterium]|nr:MMPL family transporter [Thermodesulfobacteriota bacterium]